MEIHTLDICVGRTVVKAHADGGWALPGERVTHDREEAQAVAEAMDDILTGLSDREVPVRRSVSRTTGAVITRRKSKDTRYAVYSPR